MDLPTKKELQELWPLLKPHERDELDRLLAGVEPPLWTPLPGPQKMAYDSLADELLYGGAAGGGKSELVLGLAGTQHHRAIIFRREFPRVRALVERSREIYNRASLSHSKDSYNEQTHLWRLADGRQIEFGSIPHLKDAENYRGRPHDLKAWDEVTEFPESVFRQVNGWCRTTRPGQRCRVVATGNPPTSAEGRWVIAYWAPWLDPKHTNPAAPGELRWFVSIDGKDVEVASGEPYVRDGETILPRSRTFIPARLQDNPYLYERGYAAVLQNLPEPLRSQLLHGDFSAGVEDDPWQVIPTAWVEAAQQRWQSTPPTTLSALGVDVARGGADKAVVAPRHGVHIGQLVKQPGKSTPDGLAVAQMAMKVLTNRQAVVNVDVIGIGASVYDKCRELGMNAYPINFGESIDATDSTGVLQFANVRAFAFWSLREALNPDLTVGCNLALPPDPELVEDLTAPRWSLRAGGVIQIESKDDIKKRIGRSTDCGDAVALACLLPRGAVVGKQPTMLKV